MVCNDDSSRIVYHAIRSCRQVTESGRACKRSWPRAARPCRKLPTSPTDCWSRASKTPTARSWGHDNFRRSRRSEPYTRRPHSALQKTDDSKNTESPSKLIDGRIKELGDWRGETLSKMRNLIKQVDPKVVEEWKWRGVPTWYHDGIVCTGETYKSIVQLTFAKGAQLKDPKRLFNSSLEGNVRRAIDLHEGDKIDEAAFKALVREAIALNESSKRKPERK